MIDLLIYGFSFFVACGLAVPGFISSMKRKAWENAQKFHLPSIYGRGTGFATDKDCRKGGLFRWGGIRLGFSAESDKEYRFDQDTHLTTIGPTGSAKSSAFFVPNIVGLDDRSKVLFDSKGSELTLVTGKYLASKGPFFAFAPYGLGGPVPPGVKIARYNPMSPLLDPRTPKNRHEAIARRIAEGSVPGHMTGDGAFFVTGAREVFSTCTLAVARYGPPEARTLPGVVRLLKSDFEGFCRRMIARRDPDLSPRFKGYLHQIEQESRSFNDILQTLFVETSFLLDPAIEASLSASDFRFDWLGARFMTIAICLPQDLLEINGRLCRQLLAACLGELMQPDRPRKKKVLIFCDEAASYGPMDSLVNAYTAGRAFGIQVWTAWTDVAAMETVYQKRHLSLLANSGVQIWLGTKEPTSAEHMAKQSGYRDVTTHSRTIGYGRDGWPHVSDQFGQTRREVLMLQDAQNLPPDEALLWVRGIPGVIRCKHRRYFDQWRFFFRYQKNPLYKRH